MYCDFPSGPVVKPLPFSVRGAGSIPSWGAKITCDSQSKGVVTQWRLILCDPMDYSQPDSSVHGMLQAKILE